jgi:activator of HSP90 ATPase
MFPAERDDTVVRIEKRFRCPPRRLFEALTERQQVMATTQAPAVVEPRDGGNYVLYDGAITGTFVGAPTAEKIVLKWRMRSWEAESVVDITLKARGEHGDNTTLTISHSRIPSTDKFGNGDQNRQVAGGWERILDGLSKFLGLALDKDDD